MNFKIWRRGKFFRKMKIFLKKYFRKMKIFLKKYRKNKNKEKERNKTQKLKHFEIKLKI